MPGKVQQHEFLAALLRRLPRTVQQRAPVRIEEMCRSVSSATRFPALRCQGLAMLLLILHLLVRVLGDEAVKLGSRRLRIVGVGARRNGRQPLLPVIALQMEEALVEPGEGLGKVPAIAVWYRLRFRLLGQSPHQVGAADDADDAPVTHHRHALDAMGRQELGDLGQLGVRADGDYRSSP